MYYHIYHKNALQPQAAGLNQLEVFRGEFATTGSENWDFILLGLYSKCQFLELENQIRDDELLFRINIIKTFLTFLLVPPTDSLSLVVAGIQYREEITAGYQYYIGSLFGENYLLTWNYILYKFSK